MATALTIRTFDDARSMGMAAASHAAASICALTERNQTISVVFATGASQIETIRALTAIRDIPWDRVVGFHMDEYVGLPADHPASFRRYLREKLTSRVPLRAFYEVDGTAGDPAAFCVAYSNRLREQPPALCLAGIGENGHLAFNDPAEADFDDPLDVKVVNLDRECRTQQVNEGWFASLDEVPSRAITLTIPALTRIPELILSVPGPRKAEIVHRFLTEPISTRCPATILRRHPNVHLYLDRASAAHLLL